MGRPDTHVRNRLVDENVFLTLPREEAALPEFGRRKRSAPRAALAGPRARGRLLLESLGDRVPQPAPAAPRKAR